MIGRALDKNNDLIIEQGSLKLVEDGAEVVQHIRTRLQFYRGEWPLNINSGVPYFQEIFTKPINLASIESTFKSIILNTPGVVLLVTFSLEYIGNSERKLYVNFSAETSFGFIDNAEVTINA